MSERNRYDVVIAGAGPAGSLCAIALARRGWRVLLVHAARASTHFPEILSPEGVRLLAEAGLPEAGPACVGVLSHWNPLQPEFTNFKRTQLADGAIVDRRHFDARLRSAAAAAGAEVLQSASFRFTSPRSADPIKFALDDEEDSTRFVVEAAGRNPVPGLPHDDCAARIYFDQLLAMAADPVKPTDALLRIMPTEHGWSYTIEGNKVDLTDADLLPVPHPLQIIDARTSCRRVLWRNRWLPLGDGAFTLDPLSGSGLTRALKTARKAAHAIHEHLTTGDTEPLANHACTQARDLATALQTSRHYYAEAAGHFPGSRFWQRRAFTAESTPPHGRSPSRSPA